MAYYYWTIKLPCYLTSAPHFTHTRKWGLRPKYTSAVRAPVTLLCHFCHQEGSPTATHPVRVQAIWDRADSPFALFCGWVYFESCETERNAESEVYPGLRLLLLIGNVLKTDSKTKPTSKLNCRVIILIYKLGQECKKRHLLDIFRAATTNR